MKKTIIILPLLFLILLISAENTKATDISSCGQIQTFGYENYTLTTDLTNSAPNTCCIDFYLYDTGGHIELNLNNHQVIGEDGYPICIESFGNSYNYLLIKVGHLIFY